MKKFKLAALLIVSCLLVSACSCSKESFKVKFDTDGGSAVTTQLVEKGESAVEPKDPTKDGYTFDGWYLDDEEYDFDDEVTEAITLKAKWTKNAEEVKEVVEETKKSTESTKSNKKTEKVTEEVKTVEVKYTVTFNSDGGSSVNSQNVVKDNTATTPSNPTKDGYKFLGWYINDTKYDFSSKVTSDITLVAKWEAVYTYTVSNFAESDIQKKVNIYLGSTDVTSTVKYVFTSSNTNLGSYSETYGAILVKESELSTINKVRVNGNWYTLTQK